MGERGCSWIGQDGPCQGFHDHDALGLIGDDGVSIGVAIAIGDYAFSSPFVPQRMVGEVKEGREEEEGL